jgi:hypothetical protein
MGGDKAILSPNPCIQPSWFVGTAKCYHTAAIIPSGHVEKVVWVTSNTTTTHALSEIYTIRKSMLFHILLSSMDQKEVSRNPIPKPVGRVEPSKSLCRGRSRWNPEQGTGT